MPTHLFRPTLTAVSSAALALLLTGPVAGQQTPTPNNQQRQQPAQGALQKSITELQQARDRINSGQPTQVQALAQPALETLKETETQLNNMGAQAGGAVQQARQQIQQARTTLQQPQPMKQAAVTSLDRVIQELKGVQQQTAQASNGSQRSAQVQVQQKAPHVTVQQPPPQVTVTQPEPKVTVTQPQPKVTVKQPEPKVTVKQPEPEVTIDQAKPQVSVQKDGQPTVLIEKQGQPKVDVQQPNRTAQATTGQQPNGRPSGTAEPATQATQPPANQVAGMGRTLIGKEIYGADNRNIGDVDDITMGPDDRVQAVLVDVGGFLGIGARRVAIPVDQLSVSGDRLNTSMTDAQVRDLPEHKSAR